MKVGIFGGSFDPIHRGHLRLAAAAQKQLKLAKVYFVLSPRPPFKRNRIVTSVSDRLPMLRKALAGRPRFVAARWEVNHSGPSYTVTTLKTYKKRHPEDDLYFIMGSDVLKNFHRWKNPRKIIALARLAVGLRPGTGRMKKRTFFSGALRTLRGVFPDISSTQIRDRVRKKRSLQSLVPKTVAAYIARKKLYR
ncbi:MAG: nicotinate-nucleotide adenylyltransferase [Elusimicrobia bacterium]|nr:nicotinate-nucleotide adenylyltransferase [Candidatus Obscuribacterium magneticum]